MKTLIVPFIALMTVLASCASGNTSTAAPRASTVINAEELADYDHLSALDAIKRIQPNWLRVRGQSTFERQQVAGIRVYVNGVMRGFVDELGRIRAANVDNMRFLSAREATMRYGTDHGSGAILVVLR